MASTITEHINQAQTLLEEADTLDQTPQSDLAQIDSKVNLARAHVELANAMKTTRARL